MFPSRGAPDDKSAVIQVMGCCRTGNKSLLEPMQRRICASTGLNKLVVIYLLTNRYGPTHWGHVTHICVIDLGRHWIRLWLVACSASSHYLHGAKLLILTLLTSKLREICSLPFWNRCINNGVYNRNGSWHNFLFSTGPLGIYFSKHRVKIQWFSSKKTYMSMSSSKCVIRTCELGSVVEISDIAVVVLLWHVTPFTTMD